MFAELVDRTAKLVAAWQSVVRAERGRGLAVWETALAALDPFVANFEPRH